MSAVEAAARRAVAEAQIAVMTEGERAARAAQAAAQAIADAAAIDIDDGAAYEQAARALAETRAAEQVGRSRAAGARARLEAARTSLAGAEDRARRERLAALEAEIAEAEIAALEQIRQALRPWAERLRTVNQLDAEANELVGRSGGGRRHSPWRLGDLAADPLAALHILRERGQL